MTLQRGLWLLVCVTLCAIAAQYALYAIAALRFPFGLDYSEGLMWQQALWLGGPKLYGNISTFPFLICVYPPLYLAAVRMVHAAGFGMLAGGRFISVGAALATCLFSGVMIRHFARLKTTPRIADLAGFVACLLPLTLLPVTSWSVLMRVDVLALGLTYAGLFCAVLGFRRPGWLYPALVFFVASAFTKQIFLAGALCMLPVCLLRHPGRTLRAYAMGLAFGLALTGWFEWRTDGRFLRHILVYASDTSSFAKSLRLTLVWLEAYAIFAGLVVTAIVVLWRQAAIMRELRRPADLCRAIRDDEHTAWLAFLTLYLVATALTLTTAGKTGAAHNYFLEFLCCWCLWLGTLSAHAMGRLPGSAILQYVLPLLLLLQLVPVEIGMRGMAAGQFSAQRRTDWGGLLARVQKIPGPLLSDDTVLTIEAGREVQLEPGILLEMAHNGRWDENLLLDELRSHYFGAVITAYDPGDPTFDARYLPRTQAAMLQAYPHVERFGDYRLRLPQ